VLTVNTFGGIGPLLKSAFAQIQNDDVEHLIIDIRTNGGGKYQDVDALTDYLTDQTYQWCSKSYEAPFGGYGSGASREMDCETIEPFNTAERFQGKLYLLIGPQTFSAAITFATILQDHGLANLIGEETTDTASYCANISDPTPLPRTGLIYTLARICYVRPNGVLDDLPVIPDIIVETTIEDQIAGRDPVLEYTLDMIQKGDQTP
jgi:C-terminal processing protease CtpA/Prc